MAQTTRDLDVVLFGATGFVGELTAAHLRDHAPEGLRIALAGRSRAKLDAVADRLGGTAADWERIVIDASDGPAWDELAARTKVVATTVGPYARYGREVVRACAEAGTHYCDLTGEVLFVRDVAEAFHEVAQRTGAKIVPSCGFDSVPSDLGVLLTARAAKERGLGELQSTTLFVRRLKGGLSGGTIDSMRQQAIMSREDEVARRAVADPYGLSPDRAAEPSKGDALRHETYARLKEAGEQGHLNFIGNIEANTALAGGCDVIVADGYSGNIMLKSVEGAAKLMSGELKKMLTKSAKTKLAYLLLKDGLADFKKMLDPNEVGGTALLGISRPVVKAHGSSNAAAFCNAVRQTIAVAESGIIADITQNVDKMKVTPEKD